MTKRKRKSALPFIGVPTRSPATHGLFAAEDAQKRRTLLAFCTDKAKRLSTSVEEVVKMPLSVSEQLQLHDEFQRLGSGAGRGDYGSYPQQPVRFRQVGQTLVRRARQEESNDLGGHDLADDQNDDHSK